MDIYEQIYHKVASNWLQSGPIRQLKLRIEQASSRPLVLYGAGRLAGIFMDACSKLEAPVVGVCDRNTGREYLGYRIMSPIDLKRDYPDALVLVCSHAFNQEICSTLENMGYQSEQVIPCPMKYPYFESPESFARHRNGYGWAYSFFDDERSKQLVLDRMRLYLTDEGLLKNTPSVTYYENGLIQLSEDEIFVDGGAFTGDSAAYFIERVGGKYSHIYSFEPSMENFMQASKSLQRHPRVDVIQKGLWSEDATLSFYQDNGNPAGSRLMNAGSNDRYSIAVTGLDMFFSEAAEEKLPTFIKMDIEGAEKEALMGAKEIIKRRKPKLAICAYHKPEDIYELPQTILGIRDDYRFVLRQHEYGCYDTVLYAV